MLFLTLALGIKFTAYIKLTLYLRSLCLKITPLVKITKFSINKTKLANPAKIPSKIIKELLITRNDSNPEVSRVMPIIENKPQVIPSYVKSEIQNIEQDIGVLPPIDLLDEANSYNIQLQSPAELEALAKELLDVIAYFGVKGKVIDIRQGQVVTMYEPAAGNKSSMVIGLSDDIALSLSAHSTLLQLYPVEML